MSRFTNDEYTQRMEQVLKYMVRLREKTYNERKRLIDHLSVLKEELPAVERRCWDVQSDMDNLDNAIVALERVLESRQSMQEEVASENEK